MNKQDHARGKKIDTRLRQDQMEGMTFFVFFFLWFCVVWCVCFVFFFFFCFFLCCFFFFFLSLFFCFLVFVFFLFFFFFLFLFFPRGVSGLLGKRDISPFSFTFDRVKMNFLKSNARGYSDV